MPVLGESGPRWDSLALFSEELMIPFGGSLLDELITICCLHFLPDDTIKELLDESITKEGNHESQTSLLLGNEVLEDYFLGKLVLQAITHVLKEKLSSYKVSSDNLLVGCKEHELTQQFLEVLGGFYHSKSDCQNGVSFCWGESEIRDARVLSKIMSLHEGRFTEALQKFKYGMVISLEERACLLELKKKTLDLLVQLDG